MNVCLITRRRLKLKRENWAVDFFAKISEIYSDDPDILEIIEDTIESYGNYLNYVYKMESLKAVLKIKLEAIEYRKRIEEMDVHRTSIHNAAISSTRIINRLCELNDIPLFFEGDISDRVEVADFIRDVVLNVFENRKR